MKNFAKRDIKASLAMADITQTEIARSIGVKVSSVNDVIAGRRSTRRIRLAIAEAIGKPIEQIWPDEPPAGEAERRGVNNLNGFRPYGVERTPDCSIPSLACTHGESGHEEN